MKPSRLARRFNKKGRQQKKIVVIEQNPSTNVFLFHTFCFSLSYYLYIVN